MELETKTLEVLGLYSSLDFESLKDQVLAGGYTYTKEEALMAVLADLADRGLIGSGGKYGPFWLTATGQNGKREPAPSAQSKADSNANPGKRSTPLTRRNR
jgi:hypothetical protein